MDMRAELQMATALSEATQPLLAVKASKPQDQLQATQPLQVVEDSQPQDQHPQPVDQPQP